MAQSAASVSDNNVETLSFLPFVFELKYFPKNGEPYHRSSTCRIPLGKTDTKDAVDAQITRIFVDNVDGMYSLTIPYSPTGKWTLQLSTMEICLQFKGGYTQKLGFQVWEKEWPIVFQTLHEKKWSNFETMVVQVHVADVVLERSSKESKDQETMSTCKTAGRKP